jgi:hypothetical protein
MRWLTRPAPGVILRWRTVAFFGLVGGIDISLACGQTDERDTAQNLLSLEMLMPSPTPMISAIEPEIEPSAIPTVTPQR